MSKTHQETKEEFREDVTTYSYQGLKKMGVSENCPFEIPTHNKYQRLVPSTVIDVYDVLKAFNVTNPATAHAVKKLLASGQRGYKDVVQDLKEAIQSIERAIELED